MDTGDSDGWAGVEAVWETVLASKENAETNGKKSLHYINYMANNNILSTEWAGLMNYLHSHQGARMAGGEQRKNQKKSSSGGAGVHECLSPLNNDLYSPFGTAGFGLGLPTAFFNGGGLAGCGFLATGFFPFGGGLFFFPAGPFGGAF